jgi:hypothetical protein
MLQDRESTSEECTSIKENQNIEHPPNATKGEKESKHPKTMLRVLCLRVPDPQKQKEKEKNMPYPKTQKPLCCMPLKSLPR